MSAVLAALFGVPYEIALLIPTVIATLGVTGAVLAIVFMAWAPHVSTSWATQFGVDALEEDDSTAAAD